MDSKIVFATPKLIVMFIDNLERIGMILAISILSMYMIKGEIINNYAIALILFSLVIIPLLNGFIINKFKIAHRIEINQDDREIIFFIHNTKKSIVSKFWKINKIKIKSYIIFEINGDKIYCNNASDKTFIATLGKVAQVSSGDAEIVFP